MDKTTLAQNTKLPYTRKKKNNHDYFWKFQTWLPLQLKNPNLVYLNEYSYLLNHFNTE